MHDTEGIVQGYLDRCRPTTGHLMDILYQRRAFLGGKEFERGSVLKGRLCVSVCALHDLGRHVEGSAVKEADSYDSRKALNIFGGWKKV